jgi:hypothetical protein
MALIMTAWAEISPRYTNWWGKSVLFISQFIDPQGLNRKMVCCLPIENPFDHIALPHGTGPLCPVLPARGG